MKDIRVSLEKLQGRLLEAYCSYRTGVSGVSAVEYALIVVAVIAIVGLGIGILGDGFKSLFLELSEEMGNAIDDTIAAVPST